MSDSCHHDGSHKPWSTPRSEGFSSLDVTISILTYNRRETLKANLKDMQHLVSNGIDVQVVDNGSSDGTDRMIQDEFGWVRLVRNPTNLGVAGRNRGVEAARSSIVITLDDDVSGLTTADVQLVRQRFDRETSLGAVCFKIINPSNDQISNWCHHRKPEEDANSTFLTYEISEGAVAFRREAFIAAGGYPESFFISHEGLELAYRLMNAGFEVVYDGQVVVKHSHDPRNRSTWRRYYFDTRNMIWVAVRNMPWSYATRYLLVGLASTAVYSLRDGFPLYWLHAVWDGLRAAPAQHRERVRWSARTAALCAEIDRRRPSIWYMVKKRLLRRGMSL